MANLPKKHGFLTPSEREYIQQARMKYPELAGSKKLRHDFKSKLGIWLIKELFQTIEDWSMLSDYFNSFEEEQQRRDQIRNTIWYLDCHWPFLTRFIKDWVPREYIGELISGLMRDSPISSSEPPSPVDIIRSQRDYLHGLRFANPDMTKSNLEEKRLAALNALDDLFCSIGDRKFLMNREYHRTSKVHTHTAYQVDPKDLTSYNWFMKRNYTLRFETEKLPNVTGIGKDVKISWEIDFPKALLSLIDSGICDNCFQVIERIRSHMVFESEEGTEQSGKILLLKKDGRLDATFISEVKIDLDCARYGIFGLISRDELASLFGNYEELWNNGFEPFGPICLNEPISELNNILSGSGGKRSGILSVQSKMSGELGLLRRSGKDDLNRATFKPTKRGKRMSRLLAVGKQKDQPIDCVLSFMSDDGATNTVPIWSGDVGHLGIRTYYDYDYY